MPFCISTHLNDWPSIGAQCSRHSSFVASPEAHRALVAFGRAASATIVVGGSFARTREPEVSDSANNLVTDTVELYGCCAYAEEATARIANKQDLNTVGLTFRYNESVSSSR